MKKLEDLVAGDEVCYHHGGPWRDLSTVEKVESVTAKGELVVKGEKFRAENGEFSGRSGKWDVRPNLEALTTELREKLLLDKARRVIKLQGTTLTGVAVQLTKEECDTVYKVLKPLIAKYVPKKSEEAPRG